MAFIGAYLMATACTLSSDTSLSIINLLLYVLFFWLFKTVVEWYKKAAINWKEKLCCIVPAAFFACCMLLGYSYYCDNSWDLVFGSKVQLIKSVIAFLGYFFLFWACIVSLFHYIDGTDLRAVKGNRTLPRILRAYLEQLEKRPFLTAFLTLFAAYLPYMIYSYPGIFSTDTRVQLQNGYFALAGEVNLKNHHPVAHTLILRLCAGMGE